MNIKRFISEDTANQEVVGVIWRLGFWHMSAWFGLCLEVAESLRDYPDLPMSMKHQPNAPVKAMANTLPEHGNRRQPGMLHSNNSIVLQSIKENVNQALNGALSVFFSWLKDFGIGANHLSSNKNYLVTGSDIDVCLFDRLR